MSLFISLSLCLSFTIIKQISAVSYNQPKFYSNVTWNPNATTLANVSKVGSAPFGIFINTNNTIFVTDTMNSRVQIWMNNSINPTKTLSNGVYYPYALFVNDNGDIFVDNGYYGRRVDKFAFNSNTSVSVMRVNSSCLGLFIDINDTLYCSMYDSNQVIKKWLNDNTNKTVIAAGTGIAGTTSYHLYAPNGIFVDINFDLYVADCYNNRIQLFRSGRLNGTTVVGAASLNTTILLYGPTSIILDIDKYPFVADQYNQRIVGSGPNGFRCLFGCSGSYGSNANQLNYPTTLSFDSYGNLYVTDKDNSRVQKFSLATNFNGQTTNAMASTQSQTYKTTVTTELIITTTSVPITTMISTTVTPTTNLIMSTKSITTTATQITSTALETTPNLPTSTESITSLKSTSITTTVASIITSISITTMISTTVTSTTNIIMSTESVTTTAMHIISTIVEATTSLPTSTESKSSMKSTSITTTVTPTTNLIVSTQSVTTAVGQIISSIPITSTIPTIVKTTASFSMSTERIISTVESSARIIMVTTPKISTANENSATILVSTISAALFSMQTSESRVISTPDGGSLLTSKPFPKHPVSYYNISMASCNLLKPCQNNGTCMIHTNTFFGYICQCLPGFNGIDCQHDNRVCQPDTCWNEGICNKTSNMTFNCICLPGWEGIYCQRMINYCKNVKCLNRGICQSLLRNYTCRCLDGLYFGRYCEESTSKMRFLPIISISIASTAIMAMIGAALFVIIMDILKYFLNIDPVDPIRRILRRRKQKPPIIKKTPIAIRFTYVNESSTVQETHF
ncbi:hypothetical protein I4U23_010971 [Adineta vaga]|nr:hypothetical protein I4U23_010971 [Adineta vaga]